MPTYEYICHGCGYEFELFQQMSDSVKRKCPRCAKPKLQRKVGIGAGVLFKGGGFYETDYRSESYTKAAEADKKAQSGGDAKDGKKDASTGAKDAKAASDSTTTKAAESSKSTDAKPASRTEPRKVNVSLGGSGVKSRSGGGAARKAGRKR